MGKPYIGTLTTRLSNGKPYYSKYKVTCHIKSLGVTNDCAIEKDGPGRYNIQYTSTVRGCHELTVLINGHHIAGSPFPVGVFIHPTQLGKPVKVWTGMKKPFGITANSKGEILVALLEGSTNIVKFAEEKKFNLVKKSGLVGPRCIACDDEDNIYCIDQESNKILTCDSKGHNIMIYNVALEMNSPGRSALAIINNKLYMAELNIPGKIKVYDKQLTHLATINNRNQLVDNIFADIHQNLYVSDACNSCIHVITKDGNHLRSFGQDQKELKGPCGLCVHGQYVYVADVTSHCVFVFTTDGEYVTSFGQRGQKEGNFDWPVCVFVNTNGFIYFTDLCNNRVQCF